MTTLDLINFLSQFPPDTKVYTCYDGYETYPLKLDFHQEFIANRFYDENGFERNKVLFNVLIVDAQ